MARGETLIFQRQKRLSVEAPAGEVVGYLPILPGVLEHQHFNSDPEKPVVFVAAAPNFFDVFGVDMGSGFEQLEVCPEYTAQKK